MVEQIICRRGNALARRLILQPGEAMPWHVDPFHRLTVVVRGEALMIEYSDGEATERVEVRPGQCDLDEPTDLAHRAVNVGGAIYEEVVIFFLDRPDAIPQPGAD